MSGLIIEGEIAKPDPTRWRCPACPRTVATDERGSVSFRACAGNPVTGAAHRPAAMVRVVSTTLARRP